MEQVANPKPDEWREVVQLILNSFEAGKSCSGAQFVYALTKHAKNGLAILNTLIETNSIGAISSPEDLADKFTWKSPQERGRFIELLKAQEGIKYREPRPRLEGLGPILPQVAIPDSKVS